MTDNQPIHLPRMKLTEEEALEVIDEAIQSLARERRIYDNGERRWSERTKRYEIVWAAVPGAIDKACEAGRPN